MNILDQVPGPRPMPTDYRAALRRELEALVASPCRSWRWRRASAAVYLHFESVTNTSTAFCYSVPSLAGHKGTAVTASGAPGSPAQVTDALQTCTMLWQDGFLASGAPNAIHVTGTTTIHQVPNLVVCTMPDGTAGVFPGDASTCRQLGLSSPPSGAEKR